MIFFQLGQTGTGLQQKNIAGPVLNTGKEFLQLLNLLQQGNAAGTLAVQQPSIGWDVNSVSLLMNNYPEAEEKTGQGFAAPVMDMITSQGSGTITDPGISNLLEEAAQSRVVDALAPEQFGEDSANVSDSKNTVTVRQLNELLQLLNDITANTEGVTERTISGELLPDLQKLLLTYQIQTQAQEQAQEHNQSRYQQNVPTAPMSDKVDLQQEKTVAYVEEEISAAQETEIMEPTVGNVQGEPAQGKVVDALAPQPPGENKAAAFFGSKHTVQQLDDPVIVRELLQLLDDIFANPEGVAEPATSGELLPGLQKLQFAYQAQAQNQAIEQSQSRHQQHVPTAPLSDKVDLQQEKPVAHEAEEKLAVQETGEMEPEVGNPTVQQLNDPVMLEKLLQLLDDMLANPEGLTEPATPGELLPGLQKLQFAYQAQAQNQAIEQSQSRHQQHVPTAPVSDKVDLQQEKPVAYVAEEKLAVQETGEMEPEVGKHTVQQLNDPVIVRELLQLLDDIFANPEGVTEATTPGELPPDLQKLLLTYLAQERAPNQYDKLVLPASENVNLRQHTPTETPAKKELIAADTKAGQLHEEANQSKAIDILASKPLGQNHVADMFTEDELLPELRKLLQTYRMPKQVLNAESTSNEPTPQSGIVPNRPVVAHLSGSQSELRSAEPNLPMYSSVPLETAMVTQQAYAKNAGTESSSQLQLNMPGNSDVIESLNKLLNKAPTQESHAPQVKEVIYADTYTLQKAYNEAKRPLMMQEKEMPDDAYMGGKSFKSRSDALLTRMVNDSFTGTILKGNEGANEFKQQINTTQLSINNDFSAITRTSSGETTPVAKTLENNVFMQLAEAIRGQAVKDGQGQTHVRLQLKPEHLGEVLIKITYKDGNIVTHFQAASEHAKYLIENSLAQLREALSGFNLNLQNASVSVGAEMSRRGQDWQQGRQQRKQRNSSPGGVGEIGKVASGQPTETPLTGADKLNYFV